MARKKAVKTVDPDGLSGLVSHDDLGHDRVDIPSSQYPTISFTDKTNSGDSWLWDFGDGTSSNQHNPVHVYSKAGQYHVGFQAFQTGNSNSIFSATCDVSVDTFNDATPVGSSVLIADTGKTFSVVTPQSVRVSVSGGNTTTEVVSKINYTKEQDDMILTVKSNSLITPPDSPAVGDIYVLPARGQGVWGSCEAGTIVEYFSDGWYEYGTKEHGGVPLKARSVTPA